VANGIETHQLQRFRSRISEVEESILKRDTGTVDGYDIVSLAKLVNAFDGWERILRYLHDLVESISPGSGSLDTLRKEGSKMSGAGIIDRLRKDIYTGYPTLEEISLHLLKIAETAWLREISTWVLYGRLPSSFAYGSNSASTDFFITELDGEVDQNGEDEIGIPKKYSINKNLLPGFIPHQTASSVLFIGRALSMIRLRGSLATNQSTSSAAVASPEMTLLPIHLSFLQSLQSPLSPQKLTNAIAEIRLSLSRHTLQTLLPAERILESIYVFREFYLLGRGEFALNLIEQASEQVRSRWRRPGAGKTSTQGPLIKEGEVSAILTRTWGVLSSLQGEEGVDERLDTARDLFYLSLHKPPQTTPGRKPGESFSDVLVGVPVSLNIDLTWPLELFLQPNDLEEYNAIFVYLIAVRKTQMRLHGLWQGRRNPPVDQLSKEEWANRKVILRNRESKERRIWATASIIVFFLETLVSYWQGEVIENAFTTLVEIVAPTKQHGDNSDNEEVDIWKRSSTYSERPNTAASNQAASQERIQQDPESLMRAHQGYLAAIKRNVFLSDIVFAPLIKRLLQECENLASGIERLRHQCTISDLQVDGMEGFGDEERERRLVLNRCKEVTSLLKQLMGRLHRIDEERDSWDEELFPTESGIPGVNHERTKVDRLLMRMDLGNLGA
jgi:hypothetical protein